MKTKFILHGGFAQGKKQQNDIFFQEMLNDTPSEAKILLVYFAESEDKVKLRTEQDMEEFLSNKGERTLHFRVASETTFKEDCAWADAVYLHGGKTTKIMESLARYPDINKILTGRTIAGDSAGANVLGKFFYSKNSKIIGKGLGIVPFRIVAHYEDGRQDPFEGIEPRLRTLLLREYEIKIIEQDF